MGIAISFNINKYCTQKTIFEYMYAYIWKYITYENWDLLKVSKCLLCSLTITNII